MNGLFIKSSGLRPTFFLYILYCLIIFESLDYKATAENLNNNMVLSFH